MVIIAVILRHANLQVLIEFELIEVESSCAFSAFLTQLGKPVWDQGIDKASFWVIR